MTKLYFEDFTPGQAIEHGPRLVTREEILAFAAQYDPQPMHLDEEAGRNSMMGGLGASGWHTSSLMMRMICDSFLLDSTSMGAGGVEEVKWLKPVRPDDKLTLRTTVLDTRRSRSRPEIGIVRLHYELFNQHGDGVMIMIVPTMFGTRDSKGPS